MSTSQPILDELLARVAEGSLDELSPEDVAALEAHLNATPPAAERLVEVVPAPDPSLASATPAPTEGEWQRVWRGIGAAGAVRERPPRSAFHRVIRLWTPLAAVAACLLLVAIWRLVPSSSKPAWETQLSDHVVVHELEVFGDSSAFIAYSDEGDGSAVIWVFEGTESEEGV